MGFRIGLTFLLSLIFGLERQKSNKPVGFGTFIFVAVGACGLSLTAISLSPDAPLPLLGAIITGVGFLGAGALIKTTDKIFGFTTAASIWLFSVLGLIIGVGEIVLGLSLYFMIWTVRFVDYYLENKSLGPHQKKVMIYAGRMISDSDLKKAVSPLDYSMVSININRKENSSEATIMVRGSKSSINALPRKLYKTDWISHFRIE